MLLSFARRTLDHLEPPNVKIDQIRFQPVIGAAVRIALDAGWLGQLREDKAISVEDLITPGGSKELLGESI